MGMLVQQPAQNTQCGRGTATNSNGTARVFNVAGKDAVTKLMPPSRSCKKHTRGVRVPGA